MEKIERGEQMEESEIRSLLLGQKVKKSDGEKGRCSSDENKDKVRGVVGGYLHIR